MGIALLFYALFSCLGFSQAQASQGVIGELRISRKAGFAHTNKVIYVFIKNGIAYITGGVVYSPSNFILGTSPLDESERQELVNYLKKSLKWSRKARKIHAEFNKKLGSMRWVELQFFSNNRGRNTLLELQIQHHNHSWIKQKLHLNMKEIRKLLTFLKKVPQAIRHNKKKGKYIDQEFQ